VRVVVHHQDQMVAALGLEVLRPYMKGHWSEGCTDHYEI
jgi:hypothetical protein